MNRLNSWKLSQCKTLVATQKAVSTIRKYNKVSDSDVMDLQRKQLKKNSEAKMRWGYNQYCSWRVFKLTDDFDERIFNANLDDLKSRSMKIENFKFALCRFIPEVKKANSSEDYPSKTLYELVIAIQKFLNYNKVHWKLIHDEEFEEVRNVLDNVMQKRTKSGIGNLKKQAEVISYEYEEKLWTSNILGENSPDQLHNTVLFLLGINCAFRAGREHYDLRRTHNGRVSQFSFENNSKGVKCLVYREDTVTKTYCSGLNDLKKERKIVWIYPSKNVDRDPVRLTQKYLSLWPPQTRKPNFYLRSLDKPTIKRWYGDHVVAETKLRGVVKDLLSAAEIDGYFTNHSLRRSCPTRLFQAGVSEKIVREVTCHRSNALHAYQITADNQREQVSNIIANNPDGENSDNESCEVVSVEKVDKKRKCEEENVPSIERDRLCKKCKCDDNVLNGDKIGQIIDRVVTKNKSKTGKTVIKIQIEIYADPE